MKLTKCDRCKGESFKPEGWLHRDDPLALMGDWCFRCTSILLIKGLQREKEIETCEKHGIKGDYE
jgi:hypothetical protein